MFHRVSFTKMSAASSSRDNFLMLGRGRAGNISCSISRAHCDVLKSIARKNAEVARIQSRQANRITCSIDVNLVI